MCLEIRHVERALVLVGDSEVTDKMPTVSFHADYLLWSAIACRRLGILAASAVDAAL